MKFNVQQASNGYKTKHTESFIHSLPDAPGRQLSSDLYYPAGGLVACGMRGGSQMMFFFWTLDAGQQHIIGR